MDEVYAFFATNPPLPQHLVRLNNYTTVDDVNIFLPVAINRAREGHSQSQRLLTDLYKIVTKAPDVPVN